MTGVVRALVLTAVLPGAVVLWAAPAQYDTVTLVRPFSICGVRCAIAWKGRVDFPLRWLKVRGRI
jgi:hypothetical protein